MFFDFISPFSPYSLVLASIEKINQCLISENLAVRQKYSPTRLNYHLLLSVWKCGQTRSFVFDILFQKLKRFARSDYLRDFQSKQRNMLCKREGIT